MGMPQVKLALAYKDLERLFASDPDIALEISSAIIETFAKKNLVSLLNSKLTQEYVKEVSQMVETGIRTEINDTIGRVNYGSVILVPQIRMLIRDVVKQELDRLIASTLHDLIEGDYFKAALERALDHHIKVAGEATMRTFVRTHLKSMIGTELARLTGETYEDDTTRE